MTAGRFTYFWFKYLLTIALLLCIYLPVNAQYFSLNSDVKKVNIPFKLVRNMMLIKMRINNKGPFNFVLDTGVGLMIITDYKLADSLDLSYKRTIKLNGLGNGEASEATVTPPLNIDIPGLTSSGVAAAILKTDIFNLSNHVGMPVHGLLGYEFFNALGVKIDFTDSLITVCRPQDLKPFKKSQKIPITIEGLKPYVEAYVTMPDGTRVLNKFILDLGAGHPLSLENMLKKYGLPKDAVPANLGVALNGPITGFLSRVKQVDIGKYKLKDVIASFPDADYIQRTTVPRDGNLGINILKRFNLTFDYSNNAFYIKPNSKFNDPFEHDMSGIEYYLTGNDLSHMVIIQVAPNSPADDVGLIKGDEITSINFKPIVKMTTEEIDNYFKSAGKSLLLEVFHDGRSDKVVITLRRRL